MHSPLLRLLYGVLLASVLLGGPLARARRLLSVWPPAKKRKSALGEAAKMSFYVPAQGMNTRR